MSAPLSEVQLYVGNLPLTFMSDDLEREFLVFGPLSDFFISIRAGRHRGFGFVTFQSSASASAAEKAMNGKVMENKPMKVLFARERGEGEGDTPSASLSSSNSTNSEASKKLKSKKKSKRDKEKKQQVSRLQQEGNNRKEKKKESMSETTSTTKTKSALSKDPSLDVSLDVSLDKGHQTESPYILLSRIFNQQRAFLTENKDAKPTPLQIKTFIRKTDIQVRAVLKECTERYGKAPPPHIIQNLQVRFKSISWNWNISTPGDRIEGTQPPTVAQLVVWCTNSISFLEQEMAQRKR